MTAEVDVIVPTRDRPVRLAACLEAFTRQTFTDFRLIVVDDASRSSVVTRLPSGLRDGHLLVVRNEQVSGPAASRNRGVAAGDAPYVVFLDDDARAHPELLARHHAVLDRHRGPVVSIGPVTAPAGRRLAPWNFWEADRLAREYGRISRGEVSPSWTHMYTGNVAVRRADLLATGGFDERFSRQEDIELGFRLARLGCRFVFEPAAIAWHDTERPLEDWLRIPAACARHDLLIDRLRPDSGRLESMRHALRGRHWLLRAARRTLGRRGASQVAVRVAVAAGRALYAAGIDRAAVPAFSLVWDLEYNRTLAEALAEPPVDH